MLRIAVIGAGRIGKVHIRNISLFVPGMEIKTVADPYANEETAAYAKQFGIQNVTKEAAELHNDPETAVRSLFLGDTGNLLHEPAACRTQPQCGAGLVPHGVIDVRLVLSA